MRWYISRELSDNCTAPRNQPRQTVKKDIAPCKYRCDAPMKFRVSANGIGIIGQFHFVLVPSYRGLCPCRLGTGRGWVGFVLRLTYMYFILNVLKYIFFKKKEFTTTVRLILSFP